MTIDHLSVALSRQPLVTLDRIAVANPAGFPTGPSPGEQKAAAPSKTQ